MKKLTLLLIGLLTLSAYAQEKATKQVFISPSIVFIEVVHNGKTIKLQRNQNKDNKISNFYQTTRGKIQPMYPFAPHAVETISELDMINYVKQKSTGNDTILVIDTRTPSWPAITGVIPTAINIPYTHFKNKEKALEIMEDLLGVQIDGLPDFSYAKTLAMYCNGIWCAQTPISITALLKYDYPAAKIKYFRGGMQNWKALGLTTVNL